MSIHNETETARQIRNNEQMFAEMREKERNNDPACAQLLALFRMSDKRGQDLLLAIAGIHAARYPRSPV